MQLQHAFLFFSLYTAMSFSFKDWGTFLLLYARAGGHLYFKHKQVFSSHENRPYICVIACFFLIFCHLLYQNLWTLPKTLLFFFPVLDIFAPLNDECAYITWSWKTIQLRVLFYKDDIIGCITHIDVSWFSSILWKSSKMVVNITIFNPTKFKSSKMLA